MAIEKVVSIKQLREPAHLDDLEYWMSKTVQERIEAIEYLRRMHHGNTARLQRTVSIIQRAKS